MSGITRNSRLSVALLADPDLPVPPTLYGGIERIIHFLAEGLVARGHEVTLFAHRDSTAACRLAAYPGRTSGSRIDTLSNAALVAARVRAGRFDVVHSFGRLAYLTGLYGSAIPKLMSFQRTITRDSIISARRLFGETLQFTVCGEHMVGDLAPLAAWHVIPNGVPMERYASVESVAPDAPLVFLGRLERIKGPHLAIEVAKRTQRRLVLAGNIAPEHQGFFDRELQPHLDGDIIRYVGPVDDTEKNALLGSAAAFLMPIEWDEPFGIVMAEALACGTPVIGLDRGAVPEVVQDGVTGFIAASTDGMVDAVGRLASIDRRACRLDAERRFSDAVIVSLYESVYRSMLARRSDAVAPGVVRHVAS